MQVDDAVLCPPGPGSVAGCLHLRACALRHPELGRRQQAACHHIHSQHAKSFRFLVPRGAYQNATRKGMRFSRLPPVGGIPETNFVLLFLQRVLSCR